MALDRINLIAALVYGALGMLLGIFMAVTNNHAQHVTHAHLLLVGFVVSFIYAVVYRLWLTDARGFVPLIQTGAHHLGAVGMVTGLFLIYSGRVSPPTLEPLMAGSSIAVLTALLLILFQTLKARGRVQDTPRTVETARV